MNKKYIRRNQAPFMNKSVQMAIMVKRQRNFCTALIKKTKRNFYNTLNVNKITDNKPFWKTVNPSLTEKIQKKKKNSTRWK